MKSKYRDGDTVGSAYIKAQQNHSDGLVVADIANPLAESLVDDLNEVIMKDTYNGRPHYITVEEKWDLQMKKALKRRMVTTSYRPYPENNTKVFYTDPKRQRTYYCWELPHHSEIPTILRNFGLHDPEYIKKLQEWMSNDLSNFGFIKVNMSSSHVEGYAEKTINKYRECYYNYLKTLELDEKSIETEKHFGYFWIPNKFAEYKDITEKKFDIQVSV